MTAAAGGTATPRARAGGAAAGRRLQVRELSVRFRLADGTVQAVTDVSLDLEPGSCLALVGESGCGKSVLVAALLGLLPANAEVRGSALLSGADGEVDLLHAPEQVLARQVRGRQVGLVPQSPATHLTPVRTVRDQLDEVLHALAGAQTASRPRRRGRRTGGDPALASRANATAARAGLPPAGLECYPHELSGGMAQRAVTALALAGDPWLLLADEPTTGLDRSLVDHTLGELRRLTEQGAAVLLITHDLDAAARAADAVAVMYASRIVEHGPSGRVLSEPRHPYARGLVDALPRNGFRPVPGAPPELTALPGGCTFAPRCVRATEDCTTAPPSLVPAPHTAQAGTGQHLVACVHPC